MIICIASVIIILSYYAWLSVIGQHWRHVIAENRVLAQELRMGTFNPEGVRLVFFGRNTCTGF